MRGGNVAATALAADNDDVPRWVFNIATLLSLILLVAAVAMWARSYIVVDQLTRSSRQVTAGRVVWRDDQWLCQKGLVEWSHELNWDADLSRATENPPQGLTWTSDPADDLYVNEIRPFNRRWRRLGFAWRREVGRSKNRFTRIPSGFRNFAVAAPWWALTASFAILPAAFLANRTLRRPKRGQCACGYDLTGNVSGVCPECGSKVPV